MKRVFRPTALVVAALAAAALSVGCETMRYEPTKATRAYPANLPQERVAEVQRLIREGIDWDCSLQTMFREANAGLRKGVPGAIDWFFEQEPWGVVLEDGDEGRDIEHPPGGPHEARASLARAERTRGLLAELQALHGEVCESEGKRMEGLEHLGTMVQSFREKVFGKQYGHIRLKIDDPTKGNSEVDLMWPKGDINGLEHALQYQKPRSQWKKVYDDSGKMYFKKIFESGDPSLANFMDLQAHLENYLYSRELNLILL
jgi:hypothetical protein